MKLLSIQKYCRFFLHFISENFRRTISTKETIETAFQSKKFSGATRSKTAYYVLILEDRRFFNHFGVDVFAILRVIFYSIKSRRIVGGASTIEQQLFRTITKNREKTLRRKISEIFFSVYIAIKSSKVQILDLYLQISYNGTGITGISAASKRLFEADIFELNDKKSAIIASTLLSPIPSKLTRSWRKKIRRRSRLALYYGRSPRYFINLSNKLTSCTET
jgi:penicillin-binding protein 1A